MALANIGKVEGTKRWLLLLLAIKYMFRMRPMGNFGAKTIVHQMEEGRWEEMNPHYVRDALTRRITSHPRTSAEILRRQINRGVFSNAKDNRAFCLDVFDFLPQVEGDVVYFAPPLLRNDGLRERAQGGGQRPPRRGAAPRPKRVQPGGSARLRRADVRPGPARPALGHVLLEGQSN